MAAGAVLDFETTPSFTLTAQVTDGTNSVTAPVTINLSDVVESNAPVILAQTLNLHLAPTNGVTVGTVVASDADAGQTLTYAITSAIVRGPLRSTRPRARSRWPTRQAAQGGWQRGADRHGD